ncbi:MAG: ABC transporter substrate-binding protein [Cellulosilyticaceae bacterium]
MKKALVLGLSAVMAMGTLAGCAPKASDTGNTEGKRQLVVSTWGLSEDIVKKEVYAPFEEQFNCEIVVELGTTPERYTKLATDPRSKVDVIELSQSKAAEGYAAGLFEAVDTAQIPNTKDLIPAAKELLDGGFGPAYTLNSLGIIYDKEALGFEITEFSDLWKPELVGKISIPDITSTFGPAMMHVANDYKGGDIKGDEGAAAFEALAELKPNIVKTYSKSSDLANMFASGEIVAAVVGDFAIPTIQSAAPQVVYMTPASGTYANFNTMDVNVNSENKDLAYAFIDWRLSQQLQTTTADALNEAPTNGAVVLTEEQAVNKTYGEVAAKAKAIDYGFVNPLLSKWIDQWNRILNS